MFVYCVYVIMYNRCLDVMYVHQTANLVIDTGSLNFCTQPQESQEDGPKVEPLVQVQNGCVAICIFPFRPLDCSSNVIE